MKEKIPSIKYPPVRYSVLFNGVLVAQTASRTTARRLAALLKEPYLDPKAYSKTVQPAPALPSAPSACATAAASSSNDSQVDAEQRRNFTPTVGGPVLDADIG